MNREQKFINLLQQELVVALGCTEPAAIAYAAALGKSYIQSDSPPSIKVIASINVIKNAMSVTIPGTHECGIALAAALGAVAGDPQKKLEGLAQVKPEQLEQAKSWVKRSQVTVGIADTNKKLYIKVTVNSQKSWVTVTLIDQHDHVARIEKNGVLLWQDPNIAEAGTDAVQDVSFLNLQTIWQFVQETAPQKLSLVEQSIHLNQQVAQQGLKKAYGLQVGKTLLNKMEQGILANDFSTWAMALTAAGSDARMGGCSLPVMSNSGSGNQGLAATLPVIALGEKLQTNRDTLLRAVTLSHLVTIYIKSKFGRLSAFCGAAIAATGASCGLTYLWGGSSKTMAYAIQNMVGNLTGILCDGAKAGCAMKVATCTSAAVQSALMAIENTSIQATDGIIETETEDSIENLCRLGNLGSPEMDRLILDIMLRKKAI